MSNQLKSISLPNLKEDASNKPKTGFLPSHTRCNEEIYKASDRGKITHSGLADMELKQATLTESKQLPLLRVFSPKRNESRSDVSSSESSGDEEQVLSTKRCYQVPTTVILPDACAVQYGFQNTLKLVDFQPISDSDLSDQEANSSSTDPRPRNSPRSKFKLPRCRTETSRLQALLVNPETSSGKGKIKSTRGGEYKEYSGKKNGTQTIVPNQMGKTNPVRRQKLGVGDDCITRTKSESTKQKVQIVKDNQKAHDTSRTGSNNSHTVTNKKVQDFNSKVRLIHPDTNPRTIGRGQHKKSEGSQEKVKNNCSKELKNPTVKKATLTQAELNEDNAQSSRLSDIHPVRDERVSKQLKLEVQHAFTLSVKRWAEYLGKDNLKQEELKNALQYKYNDIALDMICANDTTVWSLLQDIGQCGCSHS